MSTERGLGWDDDETEVDLSDENYEEEYEPGEPEAALPDPLEHPF